MNLSFEYTHLVWISLDVLHTEPTPYTEEYWICPLSVSYNLFSGQAKISMKNFQFWFLVGNNQIIS